MYAANYTKIMLMHTICSSLVAQHAKHVYVRKIEGRLRL
jgi:hypothetical protein